MQTPTMIESFRATGLLYRSKRLASGLIEARAGVIFADRTPRQVTVISQSQHAGFIASTRILFTLKK